MFPRLGKRLRSDVLFEGGCYSTYYSVWLLRMLSVRFNALGSTKFPVTTIADTVGELRVLKRPRRPVGNVLDDAPTIFIRSKGPTNLQVFAIVAVITLVN